MTNFKTKPKRSPAYMAFIREQPCCLSGATIGIESHHEAPEGHGTMGGKPCDSRCVPVEWKLHRKMESPGNSRKEIWEKYGKDPEEVIQAMRQKWIDA